jgi:ATP-dependent exoDNAse (exonuclease V) beta subunit
VVADWKSDSIGPSQAQGAAEGYRPQAEAYSASLTVATELPMKKVVFVFPRASTEASVSVE